MKPHQTLKIVATVIALALAGSPAAHAERPDHAGKGGSDQGGKRGGPEREFRPDQEHRPEAREPGQDRGRESGRPATGHPAAKTPGPGPSIASGAHFGDEQRRMAREYYNRPEYARSCPPGLAKKGNGCMPPGQAKKWRRGYQLPRDVVFYEVPSALIVQLGVPPAGYRYVRVAADILLIAVGTGMVIDAIEDLMR
ncbi:MAG: hypothetical protein RIS35_604 [Pseudomonadota bacterium]